MDIDGLLGSNILQERGRYKRGGPRGNYSCVLIPTHLPKIIIVYRT
jgi:hypothetical protein